MPNLIFDRLNDFPEWFQTVLLVVRGLFLFMLPFWGVIKILQSQAFKAFFQPLPQLAQTVGIFLNSQIDDPIKFPRINRVFQWAMIFCFYLLSILLFYCFLALVVSWGIAGSKLPLHQHVLILALSFGCAYMAAVSKTQASRELIKLRNTVRRNVSMTLRHLAS